MSIKIKTPEEIEKMRVAGQLAADVLIMIAPHVKAGVTTDELNTLCHDYIVDVQQAIPAPLNYHGFPKSICTSINEVICHGIPDSTELAEGDIINLDVTAYINGVLLPVVLVFQVVIAADRHIMGSNRNGRVWNVLTWATIGVITVLTVVMFVLQAMGYSA